MRSVPVYFRGAMPAALIAAGLLGGCVVNTQNQQSVAQAAAVQGAARPAAPGQPGVPQIQTRGAPSGAKQKVDAYFAVNPDCTSNGIATAELLTAPVHGTVTFETVQDYSNFPAGNQRYECNKQKTPALVVFYTSTAAYKGRDEYAVKVLFPDGMPVVRHFVMTVE